MFVTSSPHNRNAIIIPVISRMSRAAGAAFVLSNLPHSIFPTADVGILGLNLRRRRGNRDNRENWWRDAGVRISMP